MDKQTQRHKILGYCMTHGSITIREAFERLDINSPSKRISELRKLGYTVDTVKETRLNSQGIEVPYTRYFISEAVAQ